MGRYYSTKTYNTDRGLSCVYRQHKATHSHCQYLHGYSLGFKVVFECSELDERNWVMDFGGLKRFEEWLKETFDHKVLVAIDDPHLNKITNLGGTYDEFGIVAQVHTVGAVGAEAFARMAYEMLSNIIENEKSVEQINNETVRVKSVECFEHGANSAIYECPDYGLNKFGVFTSNSDTSTYIGVPLAGPAKTEKNKEDKEKDE